MRTLNPELSLEIARLVHHTFDLPKRWHQGGWGRDDNGDVLEFEDRLLVYDNDEVCHPPAFGPNSPERDRCFCLGTAIHMHTISVLNCDSSNGRQPTETMCALYTQLAGPQIVALANSEADRKHHLTAITVWNDDCKRTYADIRKLTAAVQRHLEA